MPHISDYHKRILTKESGFSEDTVREIGWWTASKDKVAEILGWKGSKTTGLVIPYPGSDGYCRVRLDEPLQIGKRSMRYMSRKGSGNRLYIPPSVRPLLQNPGMALYITEGEKKAVKATQEGFPCVGIPGVWSWRTLDQVADGYQEPKKKVLLPELRAINWTGRTVFIVFDSDSDDNESVQKAGQRLAATLRQRKANVHFVVLPKGTNNAKMGLDDYLVAHGPDSLKAFIEQKLTESTNADRNFDIEAIEKLDTDPPIYRVTVFGKKIRMDGGTLASFSQFSIRVMEITNRIPDIKKPGENWRKYLDDVLSTKLEVVEAPKEANEEEIWWWQIVKYLEQRSVEDESVLAEDRGVFKNGEYVYFHGPTLHKYLTSRQIKIEPRRLWDLLRNRGVETSNKWVECKDGKVRMRVWKAPYSKVEEAEPPTQEPIKPAQEDIFDDEPGPW